MRVVEVKERMTDGQQKVGVMIRIERRTVKATGTNDWKISHLLVISIGKPSLTQADGHPIRVKVQSFDNLEREFPLKTTLATI